MKVYKVYRLLLMFLLITLTLTGCYKEEKRYTITFNSNGGSQVESIKEVYKKDILKPNDPTKDGYVFGGWYLDESLENPYVFSRMPKQNLTLYAKWLQLSTGDIPVVDKEKLRVNVSETIQDAVNRMFLYYEQFDTFYLLPSIGDVNMLVIPIQFPNDQFTSSELEDMKYGFFGDGVRYETLSSYYEKSSYGKLNISGDVLSPYTTKHNYEYYNSYISSSNEYSTGVDLIIEELISYYLRSNKELDLSKYDLQGDGILDAVHLIYSAPTNYDQENTIYWAYQYFYTPTKGEELNHYVSWGNYLFDSYIFSGIDFFYENDEDNAWTIIHETGHLLGLEDYYDYTVGLDSNIGGLGGLDIMDYTKGDHNPFSKLLLDWIDPIVVTESVTVTIDLFDTTGDTIIVTNQFESIFDEYFIMNYYTPTGLNAESDFLTSSGLIIYHVNAKLPTNYDSISEYSYYFEYNNSDTNYKMIQIVEADGDNGISTNADLIENDDILHAGDSLILKWYNEIPVCKVIIDELKEESMTITFHFYQ